MLCVVALWLGSCDCACNALQRLCACLIRAARVLHTTLHVPASIAALVLQALLTPGTGNWYVSSLRALRTNSIKSYCLASSRATPLMCRHVSESFSSAPSMPAAAALLAIGTTGSLLV